MPFQSNSAYLEHADYTWSSDSIRLINTPALNIRQSFLYVQETGYFKTSPPYYTERANLNSFLMFYTLSGKGLLKYHDHTYHLLPRTAALINCADHHYYECLSGQDWEFLWLHFYGPNAHGYYEEFEKNGFHILHDLDHFRFEGTMRRILALTQKKDSNSEIIVSSLITSLITDLLIANNDEGNALAFMPDYLKVTLKQIENRYVEELALEDLAAHANISKFHLAREFKRYIGTTLNEYITLTRLNHAKELLKYTDLSIEEICLRSGFHYTSHFITTFKKHEKKTPLQYRKEWSL
ncbi:MAG: AraC family transcriptional regulator [Lachnospiraceae bacterium]|nr:AraC family transcriptional regulator [Lachnospiraceae bacterium]